MKLLVENEQLFVVTSGDKIAIGPSATGYTLEYSVDGDTFTDYEEDIPAGETVFVGGAVPGCYYRLKGNQGIVKIIV